MRVEISGSLRRAMEHSQPSSEFAQYVPYIWRTLEAYRSDRRAVPPFAKRGWRHGTRLANGITVWVHLKKRNDHVEAVHFHIEQP